MDISEIQMKIISLTIEGKAVVAGENKLAAASARDGAGLVVVSFITNDSSQSLLCQHWRPHDLHQMLLFLDFATILRLESSKLRRAIPRE